MAINKLLKSCFFSFFIFSMLLAGCESRRDTFVQANAYDPDHVEQAIQVTDYLGRNISLPQAAKRIVALSPHIVENLFSAGLGDAIVAAVDYADYPEVAKSIPRIGGFANFSVEAIIAYQPDLVVAWASGFADFPQWLERLEALGIPVYVDDPRQLQDIPRSIRELAMLGGGANDAVEARLAEFSRRLDQMQAVSGLRTVKLFYEIWHEPLQTLNSEHIVSDAIRLCGGENIFSDVVTLAPTVSIESVLERDPELIIASASNNVRPQWLDDWYQWPTISAVKHDYLFYIPGDLLSRHTLRMLDGLDLLCHYIDVVRQSGFLVGDKNR